MKTIVKFIVGILVLSLFLNIQFNASAELLNFLGLDLNRIQEMEENENEIYFQREQQIKETGEHTQEIEFESIAFSDIKTEFSEITIDDEEETFFITDVEDEVKVLFNNQQRATVDLLFNPRDVVNGSLATNNPEDFIFFTVTKDTYAVTRLETSNPNYIAWLYMVDLSTGLAQPTNIIFNAANGLVSINNLPEGDYLFRIMSLDGLGKNYTLSLNATNPAGDVLGIHALTPSGQQFVLQYVNRDIYGNGSFITNAATLTGSHLNWRRDFYFSWGGGYNQRTHQLNDVRIWGIDLEPVTYEASYASSDSAILIEVGPETLFTYHESSYQSGGPYFSSFYDMLGLRTPRRLDIVDVRVYGPHYLVLDLNTGEPIDFYSRVLNYYYNQGIERLPVITPNLQ